MFICQREYLSVSEKLYLLAIFFFLPEGYFMCQGGANLSVSEDLFCLRETYLSARSYACQRDALFVCN
jgi:hypothetical protein